VRDAVSTPRPRLLQRQLLLRWAAPSVGIVLVACTFSIRPPPDASAPSAVGCDACTAVRVSTGAFHTCVVLASASGSATYCFGRNHAGQLGDAVPIGDVMFHARELTPLATDTAAGTVVSCAVDSRGTARAVMRCSGTNVAGVMGENLEPRTQDRTHPRPGVGDVRVSLGAAHLVGHFGDQITVFGDDHFGQRGVDSPFLYDPDPNISRERAISADAGGTSTCIVGSFGQVACAGVLALSATDLSSETPRPDGALASDVFTAVPGLPNDVAFRAVNVGMAHACAIDATGALYCWGSNLAGESGSADPSSPGGARRIELAEHVRSVSCGGAYDVHLATPLRFTLSPVGLAHTCAITEEGALYCWGANDRGQLGDGTRDDSAVPRRVPFVFPTQVSAGGGHTCAIDAAGGLWCWGDNTYGQLGVSPREIPFSDFPIRIELGSPIRETVDASL
jgi:hypothetical protein